jgi:type IV secretion system protein VirD4
LTVASGTLLEDAALIAESIVVTAKAASDPHWDESAKNFIEAVIVHVATSPKYLGQRNLVTVRERIGTAMWTSQTGDDAAPELRTEMQENGERLHADEKTRDVGAALVAATYDFYSKTGGELSSVLSTINRHTRFLDYTTLRGVLQNHDFDLEDLKREPGGVTIYLCFPATRATLSQRWMRIFINQLLDAMEREKTIPDAPVLVCLDEFPILGYMKQLETAAGLVASFHVKLWTILQDWSQGVALYAERWETFAGNAGLLQFFGNNDMTTAEYISRRLGKTHLESIGSEEIAQDRAQAGITGETRKSEQHDLMTPDEVSRTFSRDDPKRRQLLLLAGHFPMIAQRVVWHGPEGLRARYVRS